MSWVGLCQFNGIQLCDVIQMSSLQMLLIQDKVISLGSNLMINVLTKRVIRLKCAQCREPPVVRTGVVQGQREGQDGVPRPEQ